MTGERGPEKKDKNEKIPPDARIPSEKIKVSEGPEPPTGWIIVDEEGFAKMTIPGPLSGETFLKIFDHVQKMDQYMEVLTETEKRLEKRFQDLSERLEVLMRKIEQIEKK